MVDYCMESRFIEVIKQLRSRLEAQQVLHVEHASSASAAADELLDSEKGDESV